MRVIEKYTLDELLKLYSLYNLGFTYLGNNDNGEIELTLKTGIDKISVFKSLNNGTKFDYLKMKDNEIKKLEFVFDREVNEIEMDIVTIVLKTSILNIPSSRYTLKTLNRLTEELKNNNANELDGFIYIIVDNNTGCPLYDGVFMFNSKLNFIDNLKSNFEIESDELRKNNLNLILNFYKKFNI